MRPINALKMRNAAPAGAWQTMRDNTANSPESIDAGYANFTIRQRLRPGSLTDTSGATETRLTFYAPQTGSNGLSIGEAWIGFAQFQTEVGLSGDQSMAFDGTQVQLLFGGSPSVLIAVGGSATSDPVSFGPDGTEWVVWSAYIANDASNGAWAGYSASGIGDDVGSAGLVGNQAATTAPTGSFGQTPQTAFRSKMEVFA